MQTNRNHTIHQDANTRITNFNEVSLGFTKELAKDECNRCLNCKNAPCKKGCPVSVDISEFIAALKQDNIELAAQKIKHTNSLPAVCGRVCPQESQCEKHCVLAKTKGGAVAIGALERFVGDYLIDNKQPIQPVRQYRHKVAVVGSGPAGLACAGELAKNGVEVTVYEAFHKAGGVLVYGIPEFRLPKKIVESEINALKNLGVKIVTNVVIGKTITIKELQEKFDAIFIGSGAGLPQFLNIPGENLNGVYSANEYLTRINLMGAYKQDSVTPVARGKNAVVVGAGNVAMDAARTARRMGSNVTLVYRRGRDEMPARAEEIVHAAEEGIQLMLLTNPVKAEGQNGQVSSLVCQKMQYGDIDASGRKSVKPIENSDFSIDCDMLIVAVGTSPNPLITNSCNIIKTSGKGTIVVDENLQTSVKNIYAGGDAVTGAATVILAMGAGKSAAQQILKKLTENA